jgi:hypothetical protein
MRACFALSSPVESPSKQGQALVGDRVPVLVGSLVAVGGTVAAADIASVEAGVGDRPKDGAGEQATSTVTMRVSQVYTEKKRFVDIFSPQPWV